MRIACQHVDTIFKNFFHVTICEGITEFELAKLLEQEICSKKGFTLSFQPIVAFGEGAAQPHHKPRKTRKLQKGDPILIDCGAKFEGWCSDMTRNFSLGKPSKEYREKYRKLLKIHEEVLKLFLPGKKVAELDQFVRDKLKNDAQFFTHSLGHGVGKEVHELPKISIKSDEILKKNSVVTCEPGIYFPGKFGIRIEDQLVIQDKKPEILTHTPKELIIL